MNDELKTVSRSEAPAVASVPNRLQHVPSRIALIYLAFGILWIFFTDRILLWMRVAPEDITRLQTAKGWLFVIGSAALIYILLRRYQRQDHEAVHALIASQAEVQRMNAELEARVVERTQQLKTANRELESFAYAVSHDLRAPLRSMSGFSQILRDSSPVGLDEKSQHYLQRIHESSQRMSSLIEDLLALSRISRAELSVRPANLSQIADDAAAAVRERNPNHEVAVTITPDMEVHGDPRLLRIAIENLLDNAWKYTARRDHAQITVGVQQGETGPVYFVRDNGVGFEMQYAGKLFAPFQRLHAESQFPGTGIGLVTVQRILARHGGRIWADAKPDEGATFFFTLGR
jgi:light-regulated signal transduction histidine kinase (bacteriophytochrome)